MYKLGFLDKPSTFSSLLSEIFLGDYEEERKECEDAIDDLKKVGQWLESTLQAHADRGELAFFGGPLGAVRSVNDKCGERL